MLFLLGRLTKLLIRSEKGASMTEYGLLLVVVVLALGVAGVTLSTDIRTFLNAIGTEVSTISVPNVP